MNDRDEPPGEVIEGFAEVALVFLHQLLDDVFDVGLSRHSVPLAPP